MADDKCSVCNKSFRGHDPLTDGKGRYFHHKCAPKLDVKAMEAGIKKFFGDHGVEAIQIGRKVIRTDLDSLKPVPYYPMTLTPPRGRIMISVGGKNTVVDLNEGDQIKVEKDGTYEIVRCSEKKP